MPPTDRPVTRNRRPNTSAKGADADAPFEDLARSPEQRSFLEQPVPLHVGHRERLRERFERGGADAMPDYELLELVLFRAIPRRDTKDLAKRLIARFGSFAEVINAPSERIREVKGAGDRVASELGLMRAVALRLMRAELVKRPALSSTREVIDYVRAAQAYESRELFRILFLDKKNKIIADEVQGRGTVDHTPVYVREVVKRALEIGASALILVHNHPSGDPTPSRADIDMTKLIAEAARPFSILIHDHIIVGREGHASFRALRLL
ncbi:MAG: DNA repair protein RadC [Hyphomicrobiaceae bacterium]|nr:DNA repair protein RadC [Hyphomicrobiaceae bacterium]